MGVIAKARPMWAAHVIYKPMSVSRNADIQKWTASFITLTMDDLGVLLALIDTIISGKILYLDTQFQTFLQNCWQILAPWPLETLESKKKVLKLLNDLECMIDMILECFFGKLGWNMVTANLNFSPSKSKLAFPKKLPCCGVSMSHLPCRWWGCRSVVLGLPSSDSSSFPILSCRGVSGQELQWCQLGH